jgi:plasmid replication initiation protein
MAGMDEENAGQRRIKSGGLVAASTADKHKVSMDNALTQAGHGLSLSEKRLVMLAVSKLDSRKGLKPGSELAPAKITAREYAEQFGVDARTAYEALQDGAKHLFERKITFFETARQRGGKPSKPVRRDMRWVGECTYHEGEGWVELDWWKGVVPYLVGLKKHFTTYQLQQASALRSVYSWRLLELLSQFSKEGWAEYTVEDFKSSMNTPPSLSDFAQLKRRVIEPAVRELIEKDGWEIQWQPIKAGQWKVKAIRFNFIRKQQERLAP